jgi:hypothetical protein
MIYLSDNDLEREIKAYEALLKLQVDSKVFEPVIRQSENILTFLQELRQWRRLGKKMEESFKEKVDETTTEVKET